MRTLLYNKVYQKLGVQMLLQISSIAYHQECYLSIYGSLNFFLRREGGRLEPVLRDGSSNDEADLGSFAHDWMRDFCLESLSFRDCCASLEKPENGGDLGQVPSDLDQTFSSVRKAQSELIQSAAELGVIHSYNQTPKQMVEEFEKQSPQGNVDQILAQLVPGAPAVKQARANLEAAESDLAQAELNLRYCDVTAEIDGVITRRNVNPGNNVLVGQGLMAIRSLNEIWVDANFKETQLRNLRIGQPVDLYVDTYGSSQPFQGRIAGFTFGTGSTLALLPPQNATGNFVKVVQRLPVRIELQDYDPNKRPLFIGLSVVPYVYINRPATGPDAGRVLQTYAPQSPTAASANPINK